MRITDETRAALGAKTVETLEFVEAISGWTVTDDAPPAGSPLARMMELDAALKADLITADEFRAAVRRVQEESLAGD